MEAAWKYVVICSAGIALALLGHVLLNYAVAAAPATGAGLDWAALTAAAPQLDPGVTRIAVVLLVLGFGTKAGLAPLHAWLPDAHSQAPAPVSALMSGVLLSVAFYAILRVKVIADAALGPGFARALLLVPPRWRRWRSPRRCCSPSATTSGCWPTPASNTWG